LQCLKAFNSAAYVHGVSPLLDARNARAAMMRAKSFEGILARCASSAAVEV
jgi:hypothetical protein